MISALALLTLPGGAAHAAETVLLPAGSTWRYLDTGVAPDPSWTTAAYDDSTWSSGPAPLGYGLFDIATEVGYGVDPFARYVTTWFRTEVQIPDPGAYDAFALELRRDDGALVYLNGVEIARVNLPAGAISPTTLATASVLGADQDAFFPLVIPDGLARAGANTLAIELHQQTNFSTDLVMDASVSGWDGPTAVTRGPYLQQLAPDGVLVRWVTDGPSTGHLFWAPGALTSPMPGQPPPRTHRVDDPVVAFEHTLRITGAPPDTQIGYAVGSDPTGWFSGGGSRHVFRTAPEPGQARPIRVWALGDGGTADANAAAVRDAYRLLAPDPLETDVWLMLGDNAYGSGLAQEYEEAVFQFFPEMLRQVPVWPAMGNHDGYSAFSDTQTGPYFDLFDLPTAGESGGVPSGTEAYWSFDYGNVHFVCLDSYHSDRGAGGAMATWLEADLAANTLDWVLAFFHHPPYSKGSHDSDNELELVEMREEILPILEEHGVDLVMSGHSHSYERSFLLDGHYGDSSTLDRAVMIRQDHDGDPTSEGGYTKWPEGPAPHEGAVYVVAGSSGMTSGGSLDHPAMVVSANVLGSLVLDIDGLSLTGQFLDDLGNVVDTFALDKGRTTIVSVTGPRLAAEDELVTVTALARQPDGSEPPSYLWSWGDGSADTPGASASHAWTTEGVYPVTVTVVDDDGNVISKEITVHIDNEPPVIDLLTASPAAVEGSAVTFTAMASDPAGDPVTYQWTIEDDTYEGSPVSHTFYDNGTYEALLVVSDSDGRQASAVLPVSVSNTPPVLSSVNQSGNLENAPITVSALGYDPGFEDTVTTTWTLPDGTFQTGTFVTLTWPDDGDQTVHVRLADDDGGAVEQDVVVEVDNAAPSVQDTDYTGVLLEGSPITLWASATDPSPLDTPWLSWSFDGGVTFQAGDEIVHVFGDQGPHEVLVAARDEDGGESVHPMEVVLRNVPAQIQLVLAPDALDEGQLATFAVLGVDPGFDDVLSATWSFGDGSVLQGLSVEHALPDEGSWPVSLELVDDEGEGESRVFTVEARNVAPQITSVPALLRVEPQGTWTYTPEVEDVDQVELVADGPPGLQLVDGTLTWTAPAEAGPSWPFVLTARDEDGAETVQRWSVVVAEPPPVPPERLEREDVLPGCGCAGAPSAGPSAGWMAFAASILYVRRRREVPCARPREPEPRA
jgi:PKD repeat protein